jgi:hypothetical protein
MRKKSLRKKSLRKKSLRKKSLRKKSLRKKLLQKKSLRKKSLRKKSLRKKTLRKKSIRKITSIKSCINKGKRLIGPKNIIKLVKRSVSSLGLNNEKVAYIFGESHGKETKCDEKNKTDIHMVDYFTHVFKTTNKYIDFFLEIDSIIDSTYDSLSFINNLRNNFIACFHLFDICPYKNVRFHYTDFRSISNTLIFEHTTIIFDTINVINYRTNKHFNFDENILNDIENIFNNTINLNEFKTAMNTLKSFSKIMLTNATSPENMTSFYINNALSDKLLRKEVEKSYKGKEIVEYISKLINDHLTINWVMYMQSLNILCNNENVLTYKIFNMFLRPWSLLMDIYVLSRIFKKFNLKENEKFPEEPTNILLYFGAFHANTYVNFMKEYDGWTEELRIGDFDLTNFDAQTEERCLPIDLLPEPLF